MPFEAVSDPDYLNRRACTKHPHSFFIEETLDVRWLLPGPLGEDVPARATVRVPAVDRTEQPAFRNRRVPYLQSEQPAVKEWSARQRLGFSMKLEHFHNWQQVVPAALHAQHPGWFAEVNGKRPPVIGDRYKLETTDPELIAHYAQAAMKAFRDDPRRAVFSLSPTDSAGWSTRCAMNFTGAPAARRPEKRCGRFIQLVDAAVKVFYNQDPTANYSATPRYLKEVLAANFPRIEALFLEAQSAAAAATEGQRARLAFFGDNLALVQWQLRAHGFLPETKASPLQRTDADIEATMGRQHPGFGVALAPGMKRADKSFPPVRAERAPALPHARPVTPLTLRGQTRWLFFPNADREIRIVAADQRQLGDRECESPHGGRLPGDPVEYRAKHRGWLQSRGRAARQGGAAIPWHSSAAWWLTFHQE